MKKYVVFLTLPFLISCSPTILDIDTTTCQQVDFAINDIKTARALASPLIFSIPETIEYYLDISEKEFIKEGMEIKFPSKKESIQMIASYCAIKKDESLRSAMQGYLLYLGSSK